MNSDELTKKISKWLVNQGYPLEMRVAAAFRDQGFEVQQSHYYSDPENNCFREIDILAKMSDDTGF